MNEVHPPSSLSSNYRIYYHLNGMLRSVIYCGVTSLEATQKARAKMPDTAFLYIKWAGWDV